MSELPHLPAGGPLRLIAVAGSVAILAFAGAATVCLRRREWRLAAYAALPLVFCVIAMLSGHFAPQLHIVVSVLSLVAGIYACWVLRGVARWFAAAGLVGLITAMVAARLLFG